MQELADDPSAVPGVVVVDTDGRYLGRFSTRVLRSGTPTGVETTCARALTDANALVLDPDASLDRECLLTTKG